MSSKERQKIIALTALLTIKFTRIGELAREICADNQKFCPVKFKKKKKSTHLHQP